MADARPEASRLCNRAVLLSQRGDDTQAAALFVRAAELLPDEALIQYNLGKVLRSLGRLPEAMRAYERAVELATDADTLNNLGLVLHEMGLVDEAAKRLSEAIERAPELVAAWCNLGNALRDQGLIEQADQAYQRALALDGDCVAAHYNRYVTLYSQDRPQLAIDWLSELLKRRPDHALARYQRAATMLATSAAGQIGGAGELDISGARPAGAVNRQWLDDELTRLVERGAAHLASGLAFMADNWTAQTQLFADSRRVLQFALQQAQLPGLVLELGVRFGHSLRYLAAHAGQCVHGFDSFEGLPRNWGQRARGLYTTEGQLPAVPANAELVVGLFGDTLPTFLRAHAGLLRLANVDCDIYASTRDVLTALDARIVPGSVLVFDEYLTNPDWEQDEHRALSEWRNQSGARLRYLAFSPFSRQAVVQVVSR